MKLKQAMRASTCEAKRRRSSSSHSRVAKKLSHRALSPGSGFAGPRTGSGIPDRAHRRPHAGFLAALAECERGILATLVGMMDHVSWPTLAEGHVEGVQNQLGSQMVRHRPADDPAAPDIHDDRQIEEARCG